MRSRLAAKIWRTLHDWLLLSFAAYVIGPRPPHDDPVREMLSGTISSLPLSQQRVAFAFQVLETRTNPGRLVYEAGWDGSST